MILPRSGEGLPPWRRRVSGWVMAALRLGIAWVVAHAQVTALVGPGSAFMADVIPAPVRWAVAGALVAGGLLFAWSRTVLVGFALLALGLGAFEWYWRGLGMPAGSTFAWSLTVLAVLAAGEWLVRRVQRRLYAPRP
jgi:hypothetical protein